MLGILSQSTQRSMEGCWLDLSQSSAADVVMRLEYAGAWTAWREDESVVEAVQQGMRSRLDDRGRYSPTREQRVHHFHRLLARELLESAH